MALQTTTSGKRQSLAVRRSEDELLQRLLNLYAEEREIYHRVLELSRQQGTIVRSHGRIAEVRRVLEQKKGCLELIGRLELMESGNKRAWEMQRQSFSGDNRAKLQYALKLVTDLIEEILACEEKNDLFLIEQARAI